MIYNNNKRQLIIDSLLTKKLKIDTWLKGLLLTCKSVISEINSPLRINKAFGMDV